MIKFNDEQGAYTLEIGEIVFRWEKEPAEDYENQAKIIAANYKSNLSLSLIHISEPTRH